MVRGDGRALKRAIFVLSFVIGFAASVAADGSIVLRCGRVLDAVSSQPIEGASVLVRDGRIEAIGAGVSIPSESEVIELGSRTCLPGLIDLHTHLTVNPDTLSSIDVTRSSAARALDALRNAQTMLRSGFTTLRSPGEFDRYYAVVDVRDAINRGEFVGPRLLVAPHAISATGGHGDFNNLASDLRIETPTLVVDGPDELRKAIREEIKHGADWIKLMATGGVMSSGDDPNVTTFTDEELRAAVEETHRHGKKITVHAIGAPGIAAALRAGVDSVEHAVLVDSEAIELFKIQGAMLVPTLYVLNYVIEVGAGVGFREESIAKGRALQEERDRRLTEAFASGVKVAFGSDTIFPHEQAAREFALLVGLGLSPMDAVLAATRNASELIGLDDRIGTIEAGKEADIIAVEDNPLEDIRTLENVTFVMKGGDVIKRP